jgi:hypothetical protein
MHFEHTIGINHPWRKSLARCQIQQTSRSGKVPQPSINVPKLDTQSQGSAPF